MSALLWMGLAIFVAAFLYIPGAYSLMRALRHRFSKALDRSSRVVCLTFDDGPDPIATTTILKTLEARAVRATFFVLGENVASNPGLAAAVASAGHELCEHGYSHLHPWKSTPRAYWNDLVRIRTMLDGISRSKKRNLYRPTYGKANAMTLLFAGLFRRKLAFWNVDPRDYSGISAAEIAQRVLNAVHRATGAAVILLHDGRTPAWESCASATADAVGTICDQLAREGYEFRTLSELR